MLEAVSQFAVSFPILLPPYRDADGDRDHNHKNYQTDRVSIDHDLLHSAIIASAIRYAISAERCAAALSISPSVPPQRDETAISACPANQSRSVMPSSYHSGLLIGNAFPPSLMLIYVSPSAEIRALCASVPGEVRLDAVSNAREHAPNCRLTLSGRFPATRRARKVPAVAFLISLPSARLGGAASTRAGRPFDRMSLEERASLK